MPNKTQFDPIHERPIIFSGPMVRAILEGRKTQTRRVVQPLPSWKPHSVCDPAGAADPWAVWFHYPDTKRVGHLRCCPYGKPGDRLWVRESLQHGARNNPAPRNNHLWRYSADNSLVLVDKEAESDMRTWTHHKEQDCCPSIHMPRWASRITLEITEVRVQRVQEISEEDAIFEGIFRGTNGRYADYPEAETVPGWAGPITSFRSLWDSINSKRGFGWDENPWVWAITFKRTT